MDITEKVFFLVSVATLSATFVHASPLKALEDTDSYAVYSALMNSVTQGKADKGLWMVSASTTAFEAARSCAPSVMASGDRAAVDWTTNPEVAIHVPPENKGRFREVLDDFEMNCHEKVSLRANLFKTDWPLRELSAEEEKRFEADLMPEDPELLKKWPRNATGLQSFSRVFFNHDHTLAMVYSSYYCGMLCGTWEWQVLEQGSTGWKVLPWKHDVMVS